MTATTKTVPASHNALAIQRIFTIDALRGITILVMIFVNELAGVSGLPSWMKHATADEDSMTFVDVVFPAFLFIVGMSIPFAINNRVQKGDPISKIFLHILFRTLGLLVLGVFMVNAEGGYNQDAMGIPISLWSLLFYVCAILVWNVYTFKNKWTAYVFRFVGIVGLIVLGLMYRGGENGTTGLTPQWWGILGLIGWAYLISCVIYLASKGSPYVLLTTLVICTLIFALGKFQFTTGNILLEWLHSQRGHATHTGIVVSGIIVSLIFFMETKIKAMSRKFIEALSMAFILIVVGYFLRPVFIISKIYATPTWAFYSIASCIILFSFLYWVIDLQNHRKWARFFQPAASNPLLTYIIPPIIYAVMRSTGLYWPVLFHQGIFGIIWSLIFALSIMAFVILLNKWRIKLQF